jgi:hypothetical protein
MSARTKMRFHTLATREKDRPRARALGRGRCCPRGQPALGLAGLFSGRGILGNDGSLLLLSDGHNRTTNDPTTKTQSAQRTHRDDALTKVRDHCPAWRSLRAVGSSVLQSVARAASLAEYRFASQFAACRAGRPGPCRRLPAYRSGLNLWCREKEDS